MIALRSMEQSRFPGFSLPHSLAWIAGLFFFMAGCVATAVEIPSLAPSLVAKCTHENCLLGKLTDRNLTHHVGLIDRVLNRRVNVSTGGQVCVNGQCEMPQIVQSSSQPIVQSNPQPIVPIEEEIVQPNPQPIYEKFQPAPIYEQIIETPPIYIQPPSQVVRYRSVSSPVRSSCNGTSKTYSREIQRLRNYRR